MRTMLRWTANAVAFYLALYLVDSVAQGRFRVGAVWVAVVLAAILSLLNSLIRPLRRVRSKPFLAVAEAILTVLFNAFLLQIFVWTPAPLAAAHFGWVLLMAAFLSVLGGTLNWLIGFKKKHEPRIITRERSGAPASSKVSPSWESDGPATGQAGESHGDDEPSWRHRSG